MAHDSEMLIGEEGNGALHFILNWEFLQDKAERNSIWEMKKKRIDSHKKEKKRLGSIQARNGQLFPSMD